MLIRLLYSASILLSAAAACASASFHAEGTPDQRIEQLLSQMTLPEKFALMGGTGLAGGRGRGAEAAPTTPPTKPQLLVYTVR